MADSFSIDKYDLCVVDIWSVIDACYDEIYNSFNLYNIQPKAKISSDIKNIFLHYTIYEICKFTTNTRQGLKVVFYYDDTFTSSSLHTLVSHTFLQKIIKKIIKVLPIKVYSIEKIIFSEYKKMLQENASGMSREHMLRLFNYVNSCDFTSFTFSKTLSFIRRHNLYLLDTQLLTDLKARQLLLA
jgi:hypothetical protein